MLRLYKKEKLRGTTRIDAVFASGRSLIAYPLRAVFVTGPAAGHDEAPARFLVSVPKKKLRHAVDRVKMRRRVREAYRLQRHLLVPALTAHGVSVDIAFTYLSSHLHPYRAVEEKMSQLLSRIATLAIPAPTAHGDTQENTLPR